MTAPAPRLDVDPRGTYDEVLRHVVCGRGDVDGDSCPFQGEVEVTITAPDLGEWTCPECEGQGEHIEEPPDAVLEPWDDIDHDPWSGEADEVPL